MSALLVRPSHEGSIVVDHRPGGILCPRIGFTVHRLADGGQVAGGEQGREACLVLVSGKAYICVDGRNLGLVGERMAPLDGPAWSVYAPAGTQWSVRAGTDVELAVCTAPASDRSHPVRVVAPEDLKQETRGQGTSLRYVTSILTEGDGIAESLFVIEVVTPGGHTSSYPPHKHDTDDLPRETKLEETYYSRLSPCQGFAFQRVYTDDRSLDETMLLEDRTLTLVQEGYHPSSACHGYDLYQLAVMAGPRRVWRMHVAEEHRWLLSSDKS